MFVKIVALIRPKMCDCPQNKILMVQNLPPTAQPIAAVYAPTSATQNAPTPGAAVVGRTPFNSGAGVLTLRATGTGANVKMQSFDGTVESINGTLGAAVFTVDQLPDRAGLALGGANLLGIDVLRNVLAMFAIKAEYIQFDGGSSANLSNPLRILSASAFGTLNTDSVTPSTFANNMQQNATLVSLTKPGGFIFAGNTALQLFVNNTVTVTISLMNCGMIPLTAPF